LAQETPTTAAKSTTRAEPAPYVSKRKLRLQQASGPVLQRPDGLGRTALVRPDRNLAATPYASGTDAAPPKNRLAPPKVGRAERDFLRALRQVAAHAGRLAAAEKLGLLRAYAAALRPWAVSAVRRMLGEVDARDRDSWRGLGTAISAQLHREVRNTPLGAVLRGLMAEQVGLIESLPLEAAQRVHRLTLKGLENSVRAAEVAEEIKRSSEVTEARAVLIARTEVARTASVLAEARSRQAGITHYRWQTSKDADVRPGHREMQGKVCRWDDPPAVNEGGRIMYHHPGRIWNCRCWPEPLVELEEPT
jgi:SPP1 gp7 family putative phage head morphogenesis protein